MAINLAELEVLIKAVGVEETKTALENIDAAGQDAASGLGEAEEATTKTADAAKTLSPNLKHLNDNFAKLGLQVAGVNPKLGQLILALLKQNTTMLAVAAAVGALVAIYTIFKTKTTEAEKAQAELNKRLDEEIKLARQGTLLQMERDLLDLKEQRRKKQEELNAAVATEIELADRWWTSERTRRNAHEHRIKLEKDLEQIDARILQQNRDMAVVFHQIASADNRMLQTRLAGAAALRAIEADTAQFARTRQAALEAADEAQLSALETIQQSRPLTEAELATAENLRDVINSRIAGAQQSVSQQKTELQIQAEKKQLADALFDREKTNQAIGNIVTQQNQQHVDLKEEETRLTAQLTQQQKDLTQAQQRSINTVSQGTRDELKAAQDKVDTTQSFIDETEQLLLLGQQNGKLTEVQISFLQEGLSLSRDDLKTAIKRRDEALKKFDVERAANQEEANAAQAQIIFVEDQIKQTRILLDLNHQGQLDQIGLQQRLNDLTAEKLRLDKVIIDNILAGIPAVSDDFKVEIPVDLQLFLKKQAWKEQVAKLKEQTLADINTQFVEGITNAVTDMFEQGFKGANFGKAILAAFGQMMVEQGKMLLAYGTIIKGLSTLLTNIFTAGPASIAAGIALIALGAEFGAIASKHGKGGPATSEGGTARIPDETVRTRIPTGGLELSSRTTTPESVNLVVIGPNDARAQDALVLGINNAQRRGHSI